VVEVGARERLIAVVVVAVVVLALFWILLVSPERSQASNLNSQIAAARSALESEQGQVAAGEQARSAYPAAVRAVTLLDAAVPLSDELPQLIRLIDRLEVGHVIGWQTTSISTGGSSSVGLSSIGLSFSFTASYARLQSFFTAIDALIGTDGTNVLVKGRLFTVDSVSLSPLAGHGAAATVSMTAYQQPVGTPATGLSAPTGSP
jgi:Tfp pilus assembly protein PilO